MGTRSSIAMEHPDGSITSIYCHWDGYPRHNGKMLFNHYGQEKVIQLLSLGDISSLAADIGTKHDFDQSPNGEVNAYGRDRGDTDTEAVTHASIAEWVKECGQEYNYLLDTNGVWLMSGGWSPTPRNLSPLQDELEKDSNT